ncbi:MAG TPA: hypothetical protein VGV57_01710 [Thermoleophilaceae bacterium]|nr:hypothetical protein [Thermoleophilaceae bacterium]
MPPLVVAVAAVAISACGEQPGVADAVRYSAELQPLNDSGVEGRARLSREGEHLTVRVKADGLTRHQVHGQAIHGFVADREAAECPSEEFGEDRIGPKEGASQYGRRLRKLEPFPTVRSDGDLNYQLTFNIDPDKLDPLESRTIVLRGTSEGGKYRPELPVACGRIRLVGKGGA